MAGRGGWCFLLAVYAPFTVYSPAALRLRSCTLRVRYVSAPCPLRVRAVCASCALRVRFYLHQGSFCLHQGSFGLYQGFLRFTSGLPAVYIRVTCGLHQSYLRFTPGRPAWAARGCGPSRLSLGVACRFVLSRRAVSAVGSSFLFSLDYVA